MKHAHLTITTPDELTFSIEVGYADSFWSRFKGLMGKEESVGIYLPKTKQIHMFFMKIPLDVYYIDRLGLIIDKDENMNPWRIGKLRKKAVAVLELPAGGPSFPIGSRISIKY